MELNTKVTYKGRQYEVAGYVMGGDKLIGLTLKNESGTIQLQGEKKCKQARVTR